MQPETSTTALTNAPTASHKLLALPRADFENEHGFFAPKDVLGLRLGKVSPDAKCLKTLTRLAFSFFTEMYTKVYAVPSLNSVGTFS